MSKNEKRYESLLFACETTMRNDFRKCPITIKRSTVYTEKPKCLRIRPPPLKDIHTLSDWKTPNLPFELLVKPKEVVRTNPWKIQQRYTQIEDVDKEQVRATRSRVVMIPAISIDDIGDKHRRDLLINDVYTTSMKRAMDLGIASMNKQSKTVKSPLRGKMAPANPIAQPKLQPPLVPPEWRMESASWEGKQLRSFCDSTKDFWLNQKVPKCRACTESATIDSHRKMSCQLKR